MSGKLDNSKTATAMLKEWLDGQKLVTSNVEATITQATSWHPDLSLFFSYDTNVNGSKQRLMTSLSFKGMHCGCGLVYLHGFPRGERGLDITSLVDTICKEYYDNGAGTILATLGGPDHDVCKELKQWEFKPITTYPNIRHGKAGQWKQTLWERTKKY